MTGAGAAEAAYAAESGTGSTGFGDLPDTPTWKQPFIDMEVTDASLDNALTRARQPDDPRPVESREGNLEGAFTVSGTMTNTNFHELVFPESTNSSLATSAALAPTATWYIKSDLLSGTADRFLAGAAVESVAWNYQQDEDLSVDLTIIYGAGEKDITTPSSISQPSVSDAIPFHGVSWQLNAAEVNKLQSLTVEISGMARFRRGQQREAVDAVVGAYEPSVSQQAIVEDETHTQIAYGSTTASSTEDTIDKQSGTLTVDNSSGTVATYNVNNMQPTTYNWSDLIAADTDLTDPIDLHAQEVAVA